jgi:hypothetical protein
MISEELGDDIDTVEGDVACGDEQVEKNWKGVVGLALVAESIESYQAYFAIRWNIW